MVTIRLKSVTVAALRIVEALLMESSSRFSPRREQGRRAASGLRASTSSRQTGAVSPFFRSARENPRWCKWTRQNPAIPVPADDREPWA